MKVVTAPVGAEVRLDGTLLGASPLSFELTPGKHTLQVSKSGYGEVKRSLAGVRDGQTLTIELVDLELKALSQRVTKAEAAYDKAEAALQKRQESGKDTTAAEAVMQKEATGLEDATRAQRQLQAQRTSDAQRAQESSRLRDYTRQATSLSAAADSSGRVDAGRPTKPSIEEAPDPIYYCAYQHQLVDSVKTSTCSGGSCTSTKGSLNTLTGCSMRSARTIEEAARLCERAATGRMSTIPGRSSGNLRCQCAVQLSALPTELGRLCE